MTKEEIVVGATNYLTMFKIYMRSKQKGYLPIDRVGQRYKIKISVRLHNNKSDYEEELPPVFVEACIAGGFKAAFDAARYFTDILDGVTQDQANRIDEKAGTDEGISEDDAFFCVYSLAGIELLDDDALNVPVETLRAIRAMNEERVGRRKIRKAPSELSKSEEKEMDIEAFRIGAPS